MSKQTQKACVCKQSKGDIRGTQGNVIYLLYYETDLSSQVWNRLINTQVLCQNRPRRPACASRARGTSGVHRETWFISSIMKQIYLLKCETDQLIHKSFVKTDPEGLRVQAEQGARQGYTGKQVIHPNQVAVVNKAFTPSPERVDWATELIAAFERHHQSGQVRFC